MVIWFKTTLSETGEDYTEGICYRCGKWIPKESFSKSCPKCSWVFKQIRRKMNYL